MGPYEEPMIMGRSRSIPRRRPHRQSWPSIQSAIGEEAAFVKIQASMSGIVKRNGTNRNRYEQNAIRPRGNAYSGSIDSA